MPLERPQSSWLDFLDWVRQPGQAIANIDRPGVSGRHLQDFLAGPIDALIPGDAIPTALREGDEKKLNPVEEILLNPITWTAAIPGARGAISKSIQSLASTTHQALPEVVQQKVGSVRRTLGWDDYGTAVNLPSLQYTDPVTKAAKQTQARTIDPQELLARAAGTQRASQMAQAADIQSLVERAGALTPDENILLADAIRNLDYTGGATIPRVLDTTHTTAGKSQHELIRAAKRRVSQLIAKGMPGDEAKLHRYIEEHYPHTQRQLDEAIANRAIGAGRDIPDYLKLEFEGPRVSGANSNKERDLRTAQEIVAHLTEYPTIKLKRDYLSALTSRGQAQGAMLRKAMIRDTLTDPAVSAQLLAPGESEASQMLSKTMGAIGRESDLAYRLRFELEGMPPGNPVSKWAAGVNNLFKGAAVHGIGPFVKIGGLVRNQLTALTVMAQTPEGRRAIAADPTAAIKNLVGAFDDGLKNSLGLSRLASDDLTRMVDSIGAAAKRSGGNTKAMLKDLRASGLDDAADALELGVTQGHITSEAMLKDALMVADPNVLKRIGKAFVPGQSKVANIGGEMWNGLEQRMRLGLFTHAKRELIAGGTAPQDAAKQAAKLVNDRMLNYDVSGEGNARIRKVFPFAQFMMKSIQQQGRFLRDTPAALPAIAALYGGDDLPDYARQSAHVGQVVPGFMPTDAFNVIPDFTGATSFDAFQKSLGPAVNAMHPLLGMGVGLASGRDTFTGKQYLHDARVPFTGGTTRDRNAIDVAWGLGEDAGILQAISGPAQQARSLGNMPAGNAILRYTTGINVLPEREQRKAQLEAALLADPRVSIYQTPYSKSPDSELAATLDELRQLQREAKRRSDTNPPR